MTLGEVTFIGYCDELLEIRASSYYSLDQAVQSVEYLDRTPEEIVTDFEKYKHMNVEIV